MNMISANHNYDNGYIGLVNLMLLKLPSTLNVQGYDLLLKSEFHISLLCVKNIAPIISEVRAKQVEPEIVKFFQEFIKQTPLSEYSFQNVYRLVKREERVTLVGMVDVPGIESLFNELQHKYQVNLPVQPTHITLYTLQPEAGIGILSQEQLEQDSEVVDVTLSL